MSSGKGKEKEIKRKPGGLRLPTPEEQAAMRAQSEQRLKQRVGLLKVPKQGALFAQSTLRLPHAGVLRLEGSGESYESDSGSDFNTIGGGGSIGSLDMWGGSRGVVRYRNEHEYMQNLARTEAAKAEKKAEREKAREEATETGLGSKKERELWARTLERKAKTQARKETIKQEGKQKAKSLATEIVAAAIKEEPGIKIKEEPGIKSAVKIEKPIKIRPVKLEDVISSSVKMPGDFSKGGGYGGGRGPGDPRDPIDPDYTYIDMENVDDIFRLRDNPRNAAYLVAKLNSAINPRSIGIIKNIAKAVVVALATGQAFDANSVIRTALNKVLDLGREYITPEEEGLIRDRINDPDVNYSKIISKGLDRIKGGAEPGEPPITETTGIPSADIENFDTIPLNTTNTTSATFPEKIKEVLKVAETYSSPETVKDLKYNYELFNKMGGDYFKTPEFQLLSGGLSRILADAKTLNRNINGISELGYLEMLGNEDAGNPSFNLMNFTPAEREAYRKRIYDRLNYVPDLDIVNTVLTKEKIANVPSVSETLNEGPILGTPDNAPGTMPAMLDPQEIINRMRSKKGKYRKNKFLSKSQALKDNSGLS